MPALLLLGTLAATAGVLDPVAGTYYHGDGLGVNRTLTVMPGGMFAYTWTGCVGTRDRLIGYGELVEGVLLLHPERRGTGTLETRLVPVAWGDRRYLVPVADIADFRTAIERGREPRDGPHGLFYLRRGDWRKPAEGRPALPAGDGPEVTP